MSDEQDYAEMNEKDQAEMFAQVLAEKRLHETLAEGLDEKLRLMAQISSMQGKDIGVGYVAPAKVVRGCDRDLVASLYQAMPSDGADRFASSVKNLLITRLEASVADEKGLVKEARALDPSVLEPLLVAGLGRPLTPEQAKALPKVSDRSATYSVRDTRLAERVSAIIAKS